MARSAALALALALLAACAGDDAQDCPGEPVATFHFTGSKVARGDPGIPLDPVADVADCEAALGHPAELAAFDGTVSEEPAAPAGALCTARGTVLLGERSGDRYLVEATARGAVLGACGPTCSSALRLLVAGDVVRVGGEPSSFAGVLVEVLSPLPGSACGGCALPCAARYVLSGTR